MELAFRLIVQLEQGMLPLSEGFVRLGSGGRPHRSQEQRQVPRGTPQSTNRGDRKSIVDGLGGQ